MKTSITLAAEHHFHHSTSYPSNPSSMMKLTILNPVLDLIFPLFSISFHSSFPLMAGELINGQRVTWFDWSNLQALRWAAIKRAQNSKTISYYSLYSHFIFYYIPVCYFPCVLRACRESERFSMSSWTSTMFICVFNVRVLLWNLYIQ